MKKQIAEPKEIKFTKTEGRFKVIKAIPYRGCNVVIRQVDGDVFEYIFAFDNQIYSSYIVATMKKGQKKITEKEMNGAASLIFTGATATIDQLLEMKVEQIRQAPIVPKTRRRGALVN